MAAAATPRLSVEELVDQLRRTHLAMGRSAGRRLVFQPRKPTKATERTTGGEFVTWDELPSIVAAALSADGVYAGGRGVSSSALPKKLESPTEAEAIAFLKFDLGIPKDVVILRPSTNAKIMSICVEAAPAGWASASSEGSADEDTISEVGSAAPTPERTAAARRATRPRTIRK